MSTEPELQTRDADVQAFFGLSRPALYGSALGLLVLGLGAVATGMFFGPRLGAWVWPLYPGLAALLSVVLRRSAAGRGALWTLGRKGTAGSLSPRRTVLLWSTLTGLTAAAAWMLEG